MRHQTPLFSFLAEKFNTSPHFTPHAHTIGKTATLVNENPKHYFGFYTENSAKRQRLNGQIAKLAKISHCHYSFILTTSF
jgi:hypothetical protein